MRRIALVVAASSLACATPRPPPPSERVRGDAGERIHAINAVGMLTPDVRVYELAAGGTRRLDDAWSQTARTEVARALSAGLSARGLSVKAVAPAEGDRVELEEVRLLYEAVVRSIFFATYANHFAGPAERFEYSVGDISRVLDAVGVDALAIAYGTDEISSGGRKATQAVATTALAVLGVVSVPQGGATTLHLAVVDRSGAVVWFDARAARGSYDLRNGASVDALAASLLRTFPRPAP